MAITSKYFITSSAALGNFVDLGLDYGNVNLQGQTIGFTGTSGVDAVFLRPGVVLDFTTSGSGADKVYLAGNRADYVASVNGSTLTLTRTVNGLPETVMMSASGVVSAADKLVFANGTVNAVNLANEVRGGLVTVPDPVEMSGAPQGPAAPSALLSATIKSFALDPAGETFALSQPGIHSIVVGSAGLDRVYVADGATVDATQLGSSSDLVYLRGDWADYTKTVAGSTLKFSRVIDGRTELVTVSAGAGALNDKLVFADGAVNSDAAKQAVMDHSAVALSAIAATYDPATTTPGVAPKLVSAFSTTTVNDFDVSSGIVLTAREGVEAVAGKYIRIVNDGGPGFNGESATHTQLILASDTTQVTITGGVIRINPKFHLDLANNYHIEVEEGAFKGLTSHLGNLAVSDPTQMDFATVTPGVSALANAVQSTKMNAITGALEQSYKWVDIAGMGAPSDGDPVALNAGGGSYAFAFKDLDATAADITRDFDGVGAAGFHVAVTQFGANDLLYIDDQFNAPATANDLSATLLNDTGAAPTRVMFNVFEGAPENLGALFFMTLESSSAGFSSLAQMATALGHQPVISG
ncbi:hypothetical protein [Variovorax saccharolyticus]|uniref:hypothetical protein n=1 Tax=Variovorax saccharolyticus TaxID=3053516 RepID=UPI0025772D9A|nr:hypothetical protein [Variovorax sp. J31P216]MDM0029873.1 hypothetical protein [Variovorax sp. J31P216]